MDQTTAKGAHTTPAEGLGGMEWIFAFRQGKTVFYAGSVLLWYSTGIKNRFDAAGNEKTPMPPMP
jgi:hypothetical protein